MDHVALQSLYILELGELMSSVGCRWNKTFVWVRVQCVYVSSITYVPLLVPYTY